jgi:hypothetical protein
MPRQNRVTPFGALIATPHRGSLMGNRGCLHDAEQRIRRPFTVKRWIHCVLQFKGRRRAVMAPGRYTELFFLDEATALAAGHRPCAECQRDRYRLFRERWAQAHALTRLPSAEDMDEVLHAERWDGEHVGRPWTAGLASLPAGVMVAEDDTHASLLTPTQLVRWTPAGYTMSRSRPAEGSVRALTPPSIVRVIAAGYPVGVHPSALDGRTESRAQARAVT